MLRQPFPYGSAHDDREVAEELREFLESRGGIHRISDGRVFDLRPAADVPENRSPAVQPDPDHHGVPFEDKVLGHVQEFACTVKGQSHVIGHRLRGAENSKKSISHILVDVTPMAADNGRAFFKIVVQERNHILCFHAFGTGGKPPDVQKQGCNKRFLSPKKIGFPGINVTPDDRGRHISFKKSSEILFPFLALLKLPVG